MDSLILKLLKDNGRIIIPDFGALIVKQKTPFKVIFNEFLQYNDGALINAFAEREGISKEDASAKVKQLTKEFIAKLNSGEKITLEEIGTLVRTSTGKITLSDGSEEGQPAVAPEPEVKDQTPKDDIEFEVKNEPVEKPIEKKSEEPIKPVQKEVKQEQKPPSIKKEPEKAAETKASSPDTETSNTHNAPIVEYYLEGSKRNWKSIFLWILLILIVNGAIFGFFFYGDEIKTIFGKDKKEVVSPEIEIFDEPAVDQEVVAVDTEAAHETLEEDILIEEHPDNASEGQMDVEPTLPGTKYYVVAGVFKEESNADNLVKNLRSKGYNAEKFGKIGKMHAVSYDVFPTKNEADSYMLKIKREIDKDTWIRIVD